MAFSPDGQRIASGTGPWFQAGSPARPASWSSATSTPAGEVFARRGLAGRRPGRGLSAPTAGPSRRRPGRPARTTGGRADLPRRRDRRAALAGRRAGHPDPRPGVLPRRPDDRSRLRGLQQLRRHRLRPAPRRGDRQATGGRSPAGPAACRRGVQPRRPQLALASRDVVDLWDLAGPRRSRSSSAGTSTSSTPSPSAPTAGGSPPAAGTRRSASGTGPTGRLARTLLGHRGFVRGLAFPPDGRQLVSGSEDKSVRRWDLASGGELATFHGHTGFVHCVAFSPDGVLAASGSLDGTVKLWPAAAPDSQVTFRNGSGWVGALAFHPTAAGSPRRTTATSGSGTRAPARSCSGSSARAGCWATSRLAFSPDGTTLAASGPGGSHQPLGRRDWARRCALAGASPRSATRRLAPTARSWPPPADDGSVRLWDVARGTTDPDVPGPPRRRQRRGLRPDGRRLATAGEDRKVRVWDVATGTELVALHGPRDRRAGRGLLSRRPPPRLGRRAVSRHAGRRGQDLGRDDRQPSSTLRGPHQPGHRRGLFPRRPTAGHRQRRPDDQALGPRDRRGRPDAPRPHQRRRQPGHQPRRPPGRLGEHRLHRPDLEHRAPGDRARPVRRRAAVERVQSLFAHHLLKADVLEVLRADRTQDEPRSAPRRWRSPDAAPRTPRGSTRPPG